MRTVLVSEFMAAMPHSIGVTLAVSDASNMMRAFGIRHLPVLDAGRLVGIVSDRDVQMIELVNKASPDDIPLEQAMSTAVYTVSPSTPLEVVATHMHRHRLGSAVVMDGQRVVGVFTATDALRALAAVLAGIEPASERYRA